MQDEIQYIGLSNLIYTFNSHQRRYIDFTWMWTIFHRENIDSVYIADISGQRDKNQWRTTDTLQGIPVEFRIKETMQDLSLLEMLCSVFPRGSAREEESSEIPHPAQTSFSISLLNRFRQNENKFV